MKYIVEWSKWNPVVNKEVVDYIETNKRNLLHLWDEEKSEEENIKFLTDYFTAYPDLMKSEINIDNVRSLSDTTDKQLKKNVSNVRTATPVLQNIGGVADFRSF